MKITKDMKQALDAIIPAEPDMQYRWFTLEYGVQLSGISYNEFLRVLNQLVKNGLAEYGDPKYKSLFLLTEYGVKYKEIRRMELADQWKERLIGFVSGIILSLIAWGLSALR